MTAAAETSLVVHQRHQPAGRPRVWVGLRGKHAAQAAPPQFFVGDTALGPDDVETVRAWGAAATAQDGAAIGDVVCGVFDLPAPPSRLLLTVAAGGLTRRVWISVLPAKLPALGSAPHDLFNVLLFSCFDRREEPQDGLVDAVVGTLRASEIERPDLALFMGDQVYLDMPLRDDFPEDADGLRRVFHGNYATNWFERLRGTLGAAPAIHLPDDHEYWNNYPHPSPIVPTSLRGEGRERWREAAADLYGAFQHADGRSPLHAPPWSIVECEPLSFFVADTRSVRDGSKCYCLPAEGHAALAAWADEVRAKRRIGVFVSGQSLLAAKAGRVMGGIGDWELPNYEDYDEILRTLDHAVAPGRTLLCLTGDVHWGRVTSYQERASRRQIVEVIVSPASLVRDPRLTVRSWFRPFQDFPRHTAPNEPPPVLVTAPGTKFDRDPGWHQQVGDQVALLSFQNTNRGPQLEVAYYPIHTKQAVQRKVSRLRIQLHNPHGVVPT